jgi:hypothetical protein
MENVVGKTYGLLTVLAEVERKAYQRRVVVHCSCESATEKVVYLGHLLSGNTSSCGCVQKAARVTHGLRKHPLYRTWAGMLTRCRNPNEKTYKDYGGRGITVCERWQKFENFYSDMQPTYKEGLTLDRKDNSKGYCVDNCRWASPAEQAKNRRSNINVTLNERTQCLKAWCEELNLNYKTVHQRLKSGKTPEQALQIQKNST